MDDRDRRSRNQEREVPFSDDATHIWDPEEFVQEPDAVVRRRSHRQPPTPDTELQAVMEAPPGHEPRPSKEGSLGMMEALHDAIDCLPEKQRWVVEAHQWRGLTFAEIGQVLSVSRQRAQRIYEQALARLESHLRNQIEED